MLKVVNSLYTLDDKVLIYENYVDVLRDVRRKIDKYYSIGFSNVWYLLSVICSIATLSFVIIGLFNYINSQLLSVNVCLIGLCFAGFCWAISLKRYRLIHTQYMNMCNYLDNEKLSIEYIDFDVRSLRLMERLGFQNISKINTANKMAYLYFPATIYNKPSIIDTVYVQGNTLNLSVYDTFYQEIEQRMLRLQGLNNKHKIDVFFQEVLSDN